MSAAITDAVAGRARIAQRIHGLYAVTPDSADTSRLVAMVEAAVHGGARVVQYRNKTADASQRAEQALALKVALERTQSLFIINDDVELAAQVRAHGVHIGENDPDLDDARQWMGRDAIIGVSCYNDIERARAAAAAGADYVAFGSFYASGIKPDARRADIALLQQGKALGVPVVAIGGITAQNARALREAGADAVAVISAVFGSGEPHMIERAARDIARMFEA
ncbi:MAG TPA: thiamine phosphate synthase [Casimicrobiaceae bacterium]|nr:thiamine phosphate synthase [Casimicrobiaceae bacterium]